MKTRIIILVTILIGSMSWAQSIERFSIDSGGASATAGGIQILYTIGEVNVAERTSPSASLSEGFITESIKVKINAGMFLQGPLLNPATAGLMNDDLRAAGLIPTTSPYVDAKTVNIDIFDLGGASGSGLPADDIVDWVFVELRSKADNSDVVSACSALLQRDGDVVGLDGVSDLVMPGTKNDYYVVLKHRNHLAIMTDATVALSEIPVSVDFTTSSVTTEGGVNSRVTLGSGELALWAGDGNDNGQVIFSGTNNDSNTIKDHILSDPGNLFNFLTYESTGYLDMDVDMSGSALFSGPDNDSNIIKDNVLAHPDNFFNFLTYTISTSVPPEN